MDPSRYVSIRLKITSLTIFFFEKIHSLFAFLWFRCRRLRRATRSRADVGLKITLECSIIR